MSGGMGQTDSLKAVGELAKRMVTDIYQPKKPKDADGDGKTNEASSTTKSPVTPKPGKRKGQQATKPGNRYGQVGKPAGEPGKAGQNRSIYSKYSDNESLQALGELGATLAKAAPRDYKKFGYRYHQGDRIKIQERAAPMHPMRREDYLARAEKHQPSEA